MTLLPLNDGNRHTSQGLPEDGTNVDIDGHADWNTASHAGRRLTAVNVAAKPTVCPSCDALIDPLTLECRC